ncbi:MAG: hypothetical protein ACTHN4_03775 [Sphingomicrobium sp.]
MDFTSEVPTVAGIVEMFKQIPADLIPELPLAQQRQVHSQAQACWSILQSMMKFDPVQSSNASGDRQSLISQLDNQYGEALAQLSPVLALSAARQRSLTDTELRARQIIEDASDAAQEVQRVKEESERVITTVRDMAAKAGVSQQAPYFGEQAASHSAAAGKWLKTTYGTAAALVLYALLTWWLGAEHPPTTPYAAVQTTVSKVLIFSTIAYMLFFSSRTLMAHRHNEVVNKHRQNALLTFNALADAASSEQTREVVLTQASQCIYAPQDSGFTKAVAQAPSLVEIVPKVMGAEHVGG